MSNEDESPRVQLTPLVDVYSQIPPPAQIDGRPRLRNITFDGISLLEAGNTNTSICLCLIMQV